MGKRARLEESGDSEALQALFDSIAVAPAGPETVLASDSAAGGDSADLQALFDSVACESGRALSPEPAAAAGAEPLGARAGEDQSDGGERSVRSDGELFVRLGRLTRGFHEALSELGYDRLLEETARAIPDARQRLSYVAEMTEQAASRVLNATDVAKPIQEQLERDARLLGERWDRLHEGKLSVAEFRMLAGATRDFFKAVPGRTRATNDQLTEIMMAQDFQDLTGQVIKKLVDTTQKLETQLLELLVEFVPSGDGSGESEGLMNGPAVGAAERIDVVSSQRQVDDLLESMGF